MARLSIDIRDKTKSMIIDLSRKHNKTIKQLVLDALKLKDI